MEDKHGLLSKVPKGWRTVFHLAHNYLSSRDYDEYLAVWLESHGEEASAGEQHLMTPEEFNRYLPERSNIYLL